MRIVDMASSPGFNPSTNSGRGEWSLRDVSNGDVFLDDWWQKPECIDHGAMNCVSKDLTIWRCIECGRGAFDMDTHEGVSHNSYTEPFADRGPGKNGKLY